MKKVGLFSVNDVLVVEPYKQGQGLQAEVRGGFAYVRQKKDLVGLSLLIEARLSDGSYLPQGSTVYISEEMLSTAQWAKNIKQAKGLGEEEFILVELKYVSLIDTNEFVVENTDKK